MSIHFLRSGRKSTTVKKVCTKIGTRTLYAKEGWALINGIPTKVYDSGYVPPVIPDPEPEPIAVASYLAVTYDGSIYYSADGINFTKSTHLVSAGKHACVYNPDDQYFYICNLGQIRADWVRTHDGVTFEPVTAPEGNLGVVGLADGYIVVLENGTDVIHYAKTTSPQTWTRKTILDLPSNVLTWKSIKYCPNSGKWIAQITSFEGSVANGWFIAFSNPESDISVIAIEFSIVGPLVEAGDRFYVVKNVNVGERPYQTSLRYLMSSENLIDWTQEIDLGASPTGGYSYESDFTAYNGAVTVSTATTSASAINVKVAGTWSLYALPDGMSSSNYPMVYLNGVFIVIKVDATSSYAAWSADGTNWQQASAVSNTGCRCIIKTNRIAYFISEDSVVQCTANGQNWSTVSFSGNLYRPTDTAIASSEV